MSNLDSDVTDMGSMFNETVAFNGDLSSLVADTSFMFRDVTVFNQDLSNTFAGECAYVYIFIYICILQGVFFFYESTTRKFLSNTFAGECRIYKFFSYDYYSKFYQKDLQDVSNAYFACSELLLTNSQPYLNN